ncbi:MAG: DUF4136 domain-containing protein [Syntrophaceae bacterium]|nr:DUF4136 domain-containing protein [Syntrophaceae bacterium]
MRRFGVAAALLAAGIMIAGCAATINHAYDPAANFTGLKSYNWAAGGTGSGRDLVVKNVQYHADRVLEKKGFRRTAENPDMLITISYENEIGISEYGYRLRMLTLAIQKADGRQAIWRGTATGSISADAGSGDLQSAVEAILKSFPPMK